MGFSVQGGLDMSKIQGLQIALEDLSVDIAEEYLKDVKAADVIPVETGALMKSLKVKKAETGAIINSVLPYADLRYHINPKNPDKTLWFERVSSDKAVQRVVSHRRRDLG